MWTRKRAGKYHVRVHRVDKEKGWEVSCEGPLCGQEKWLGSVM